MLSRRDQEAGKDSYKDRGWAWVIAIAGMLAMCLTVGENISLGMLMVELMDSYETSTTEVSYIATFSGIGTMLASLLFMFGVCDFIHERALVTASGILNTFGFIVAYFSHTVAEVYILGLCCGVAKQSVFVCSLAMAGKYFKKRLATGSGLITAGTSCGILLLPPFLQWLFDEFTYRGASLVMAGVSLNVVVSGSLMRPAESPVSPKTNAADLDRIQNTSELEKSKQIHLEKACGISNEAYERTDYLEIGCSAPEAAYTGRKNSDSKYSFKIFKAFVFKDTCKSETKTRRTIFEKIMYSFKFFKSPTFVLYSLFVYLSSTGSQSFLQFYPAITRELNVTNYQSAMLISIVGGMELIGKLLFGFFGDFKFIKPHVLIMIPQFILCGACFLCHRATEFWSQVIFAIVMGVSNASIYSLHSAVLVELFGLPTLARRLGVLSLATGIGLFSGGLLIGYIRDETGDYNIPMQTLGTLFFVGGSALLVITMLKCRERCKDDSG